MSSITINNYWNNPKLLIKNQRSPIYITNCPKPETLVRGDLWEKVNCALASTSERWVTWEWKSQSTCKHVERWMTWEWKSTVTREHVLRDEVTCEGSQWCICKHVERWLTWEWNSTVTCKWRSAVLLVDTSRATPVRPRRLSMGPPEAAAEVEVEAGLGEMLSRQQQRWGWWFGPNLGSLGTSGGWKSHN